MSVNYKLIADNDPGGTLEDAYTAMSAETVTTAPKVMVTYRKVAASVNLEASAELEASVIASVDVPDWVNIALADGGINVNDPQTEGLLSTLVSPQTASAILDMGIVTDPKYPGLKIGHLSNARQMRTEGRV